MVCDERTVVIVRGAGRGWRWIQELGKKIVSNVTVFVSVGVQSVVLIISYLHLSRQRREFRKFRGNRGRA